MNKIELINEVAACSGASKAQSRIMIDCFIQVVQGALVKGDRVAMVGFGSFSISKRAARKGRNPQTGKEINIAAKKVVKFKPGASLQKTVK